MKAGTGDIHPANIKEPSINQDFDAIMRLIVSAICVIDLHFALGTVPGMPEDTILGHKGIGVVEAHNSSTAARISKPPKSLRALPQGPCI